MDFRFAAQSTTKQPWFIPQSAKKYHFSSIFSQVKVEFRLALSKEHHQTALVHSPGSPIGKAQGKPLGIFSGQIHATSCIAARKTMLPLRDVPSIRLAFPL
eukprot:1139158-Pelagomonas_calceolata.AAC.2